MAKGSALAILALLIGIGGIAVGGYSLFSILTEPGVHRTYQDSRTNPYTPPSEDSWAVIPGLSITFQVDAGESVHFLFTCTVYFEPVSGIRWNHFVLKVDGSRIYESQATVGPTGGTATEYHYSVALQYCNTTMPSGQHVVVVEYQRETNANSYADNCWLFVQTYT